MSTKKNKRPAPAKNEQNNGLQNLIIAGNNENILIDARLLHQRLMVGRKFSMWIKERIYEFGFEQNKDYFIEKSQNWEAGVNQGVWRGGQNKLEYSLTVDMAKELAMLERNEVGKRIRRYFIEVEKEARANALPVARFPRGVKFININNREITPLREFYKKLGIKAGGSLYAMRKRYPNQFVDFNNVVHITKELCQLTMLNRTVRHKREVVKAMQPVLPLDFGAPIQLKGGHA